MTINRILRGLAASGAMLALTAGASLAQECTETQFSSKNAEFYLKAETELLTNKNAQAALGFLNQLRNQEMNCYEEGSALRLGAAIKIEAGDYAGAVRDLEAALNRGFIPQSEHKTTYYNISQIYLNTENLPKAMEYFDKWLAAGGAPNRDTKWQLAVINQKLERPRESLRWAEEVFAADGPNADRQVYDFLIYLYDETGQLAKKAQLLEQLLAKNPNERRLWDAISGDYFRANEDRKAFEVQKAMYLGGILQTEDEIMRVVNFYNTFNAPYQAAKILNKEMNQGRINKTYNRMELLANLYQVAREYERAIPVIEEAAQMSSNGEMYERLGRSYTELQEWAKAEEALTNAINKGGLKDRSLAWVLIGQSRYERGDRAGAREAFRQANSRAGRGWIDFMASEDATERALVVFEASSLVQDLTTERKRCKDIEVLGGEPTEACQTVDQRLDDATAALAEIQGTS
ncbi:MAG: tetratricopeptide repeat protein [Henriciella sp.]|nr:tetratricopeptide repeat protein [Henriciella sp.]